MISQRLQIAGDYIRKANHMNFSLTQTQVLATQAGRQHESAAMSIKEQQGKMMLRMIDASVLQLAEARKEIENMLGGPQVERNVDY